MATTKAKEESKNMLTERKNACYVLSDEIYEMLEKAQKAKFLLGELRGDFFDDESPRDPEVLLVGYQRARVFLEMALDYSCEVCDTLAGLDAVTSV